MLKVSDSCKQYFHLMVDLYFALIEEDETKAEEIYKISSASGYEMSRLENDAAHVLSGDLHDNELILKGIVSRFDISKMTRGEVHKIYIENEKKGETS